MSVILVVDDDRDIRQSLADVLEGEGYTVVAVADGKAALERLRDDKAPAAILLDVMMPVMNGVQFRVEQRARQEIRDIPTVVMSALSVDQVKAMGLAMDGAHYLRKPVELGELLRVVALCCAP